MEKILIYVVIGVVAFVLGRYFARKSSGKIAGEKARVNPVKSCFAGPLSAELNRVNIKKALDERTENRKSEILEMLGNEQILREKFVSCNVSFDKEKISDLKVTREDVEKLLKVSPNTALKYLNELETENKIIQVGDIGRGVFYKINNPS